MYIHRCVGSLFTDIRSEVILADKFDITLGRIEVTVPWVEEGSDYSVVRAYHWLHRCICATTNRPIQSLVTPVIGARSLLSRNKLSTPATSSPKATRPLR